MIKVGVIIPTRGDRPRMLANCIRMINAQTFQPTLVYIVDYPPEDDKCDITKRYRTGYDWFRGMGMDVLAFMEDDDWYSPKYLATIVGNWILNGRPQLFGTNYTYYYHFRLFGYFKMTHMQRSSAMSTLIKPDIDIKWCADDQPYTDSHLWFVTKLEKKLFEPQRMICMGMKHGVGKNGGQNHNDRLDRYTDTGTMDPDKKFLRDHLDLDSFDFYSQYFQVA